MEGRVNSPGWSSQQPFGPQRFLTNPWGCKGCSVGSTEQDFEMIGFGRRGAGEWLSFPVERRNQRGFPREVREWPCVSRIRLSPPAPPPQCIYFDPHTEIHRLKRCSCFATRYLDGNLKTPDVTKKCLYLSSFKNSKKRTYCMFAPVQGSLGEFLPTKFQLHSHVQLLICQDFCYGLVLLF